MKKNLLIATLLVMATTILGGCGLASEETDSKRDSKTHIEQDDDDRSSKKDRDKDKDSQKDSKKDNKKDNKKDGKKDSKKDSKKDAEEIDDEDYTIETDEDDDVSDKHEFEVDDDFSFDFDIDGTTEDYQATSTGEYETLEEYVYGSGYYDDFQNQIDKAMEDYKDNYSYITWSVDGNVFTYEYWTNDTTESYTKSESNQITQFLEGNVPVVIQGLEKESGVEGIGIRYVYCNMNGDTLYDHTFYED